MRVAAESNTMTALAAVPDPGYGYGLPDGSGYGSPGSAFVLRNYDGVLPELNQPLEFEGLEEEPFLGSEAESALGAVFQPMSRSPY